MRYTEYHAGVPVIRDTELLPGAMRKLARLEDLGDIRGLICDRNCKYPYIAQNQETMNYICENCKLVELFEALEEFAPAQL